MNFGPALSKKRVGHTFVETNKFRGSLAKTVFGTSLGFGISGFVWSK